MTNIAKLRSGEAVFSALYETAVGLTFTRKRWSPAIRVPVSATVSSRLSIVISEQQYRRICKQSVYTSLPDEVIIAKNKVFSLLRIT